MVIKKIIAAIAATAISICAIVAPVSAETTEKTLSYTLVETYKSVTPYTATATFETTLANRNGDITNIIFTNTDTANIGKLTQLKIKKLAYKYNSILAYSSDDKTINYNPKLANVINGNGSIDISSELLGYTDSFVISATFEVTYDKIYNLNIAHPMTITCDGTGTATTTTCANFTKTDNVYYKLPFKTDLTNNTNILTYLSGVQYGYENKGIDIDGENRSYFNVNAVVNDAVANNYNVKFVFHSAKDGIVWTPANTDRSFIDFYGDGKKYNNNYDYTNGLAAMGGDASKLIAVYATGTGAEWYANTNYKTFGQHLYTNYYMPEGTEYLGFDWNGINLFAGALVINEGITMSLADTDIFEYTSDTLSFDWDSIISNSATANDYATYIHSMKLATSTTWYWDSLDIIIENEVDEDVSAASGIEADDETLIDDAIVSKPDTIENEDPPIEDEIPDPIDNPTTGNNPIPLAIIPMALAAAAVVAKKSN